MSCNSSAHTIDKEEMHFVSRQGNLNDFRQSVRYVDFTDGIELLRQD